MTIPSLSISRINQASFPSEEYCLSPSKVSFLVEGCSGSEHLRSKLRVAYAETLDRLRTIPFYPFTALEGRVLHQLADFYTRNIITNEDEVFDRAEELLLEERRKLSEIWPMLNTHNTKFDFGKVSLLIDYFANKKIEGIKKYPLGHVKTEKSINCKDTLGLCGVPDYLWIEGSEAVIKDYKTGSLTDSNGEIKSSFSIQLNLYRLMVEKKYPVVRHVKMYLDNLSGQTLLVKALEDQTLMEKLHQLKSNVIEGLYNPGEHCNSCPCCHICAHKTWIDPSTQDYFDFLGYITIKDGGLIIHHQPRGQDLLLIRTDSNASLYNTLKGMENRSVYLSNLKKLTDKPLIATISHYSVACEIAP